MPETDTEGRTTWGGGTGWNQDQKPVSEPPADAQAESSPADAEADSSPAQEETQEQTSEQAPPPSSQPEPERKWNQPPPERWDELRKERDEARELARLALEKYQAPQQPQAPEADPYAGMDPQTAEFYRQMDQRIEKKASAMAEQKLQTVMQAVDAGRRELAEIKVSQFQRENPDIKPGSPEYNAIAGYVAQGFDMNTAKKLATYGKLEAELQAIKSKQSASPKKARANVESSSGIPQTAGLPQAQRSWRDEVSEAVDRGEDLTAIASRVFGGKRKT